MDMNRKLVNLSGWGVYTVAETRLLLKGMVSRADKSGKRQQITLSHDDRILLEFLTNMFDWSKPYGGELTLKEEDK